MTNTSFGVAPPGHVPDAILASEPTVLAQIERLIRLDLCRSGPVDDAAWRAHERQQAAGAAAGLAAVARALAEPPSRVLLVAPIGSAGRDAPIGAAVLARLLLQLGHQPTVVTEPGREAALEALLQAAIGADRSPQVGHWGDGEPREVAELACAHDRVCLVLGSCERSLVESGPVEGVRRCAARSGQPTVVVREAPPGEPRLLATGMAPAMLELLAGTSATGVYGIAAAVALLRGDPSLCATAEDEAGLALVAEALGLTGRPASIGAWEGWSIQPRAAVVGLLRSLVERSVAGLRRAPAQSPRA